MNVFCFSGNICKDIELRSTQSGKQVASFSIAINESKDKTEFINCVAWEKTAELINQYCAKGDRLSGSGRIQTRKWEDSNGQTKYATECVVSQFDFPPKKASGDSSNYQTLPQTSAQEFVDDMDDEIPF